MKDMRNGWLILGWLAVGCCSWPAVGGAADLRPPVLGITDFSASVENGWPTLTWQVDYGPALIGFEIQRRAGTNDFAVLTPGLLPVAGEIDNNGAYRYVDASAAPAGTLEYRLVSVDTAGRREMQGTAGVQVAKTFLTRRATPAEPYLAPPVPAVAAVAPQAGQAQALSERDARTGERIKISVKDTGIYFLSSVQIAAKLAVSTATVTDLLARCQLRLSSQGRRVAYLTDTNGLYFFNRQLTNNIYTDYNIFWLEKGRGLVIPPLQGTPPAEIPPTGRTFIDACHFEVNDNYHVTDGLFSDPAGDFWLWLKFYNPVTNYVNFTLPGLATNGGDVSMTVALKGGSSTRHHAVFYLNGKILGDVLWENLSAATWSAGTNTAVLTTGVNALNMAGLLDQGDSYGVFYLDYFDVIYPRAMQAWSNQLVLGSVTGLCSVGGFSESGARVADVTAPDLPRENQAVTIRSVGSTWAADFQAESGRTYAVFSPAGALSPVEVVAARPFSLRSATQRGNYLLITADYLTNAVAPLVTHRRAQGWEAKVVLMEDVYNEFAWGLAVPEALKRFYQSAATNWQRPPTHVLLAGNGTFDYRNFKGTSQNVVPTALIYWPNGIVASDTQMANYDDNPDSVPKFAVGRLAFTAVNEISNLVLKILNAEQNSGQPWAQRMLFASDTPDPGAGDFPASVQAIADEATGAVEKEFYSVTNYGLRTTAHTNFCQFLNHGDGAVVYVGHGGPYRLGLFLPPSGTTFAALTNALLSLTNAPRTPMIFLLTCGNYTFQNPGLQTLAQAMLNSTPSGAVAAFASTTLSENSLAQALGARCMRARYAGGAQTVGDVLLQGQWLYSQEVGERFHLQIYNLLGDPAMPATW